MNERIRELALEARIAYYSKNGSYEGSDDGLSVIPSTQSLEKFAELLVRECVGLVNEQLQHNNPNDSLLALKIKEHFGVRE